MNSLELTGSHYYTDWSWVGQSFLLLSSCESILQTDALCYVFHINIKHREEAQEGVLYIHIPKKETKSI